MTFIFDPDLPALSVIGNVGDGHWFFVGAGFAHKFTSTTNGQLYLAFNDSYFGDNSGAFSALIVCSGCSARKQLRRRLHAGGAADQHRKDRTCRGQEP